ncbi:hypothetical protein DSO57_1030661 [Entomophthora muscae]|uniref:Uncharacterized protein n=1 Tax=Entomophthora muscae TaxID=34485 RepID=A0ACC2TBW9_9FUNG|nr:hypothetical protein DSO57_1030661 [Entomophthora muscae]
MSLQTGDPDKKLNPDTSMTTISPNSISALSLNQPASRRLILCLLALLTASITPSSRFRLGMGNSLALSANSLLRPRVDPKVQSPDKIQKFGVQ